MLDHLTRFFRRIGLPAVHARSAERLSDLDALLSDSALYLDSDADTRHQLRAQICRFAARHRLTDEQAAHLWKDGQLRPTARRFPCIGLLTSSLLLALTASGLLFGLFYRSSLWLAILTVPTLFCPIWELFSLLTEGAVRRLFPTAKIPVLHKEKAPPICAMLIASVQDDAVRTVERLETLIDANRHAEGLFGLILLLPDAPARYTACDKTLCEPFLAAFHALEKRTNRPLRLVVCRRSYLPREKRWSGTPSYAELLSACRALLCGEEAPFEMTVGQKAPERAPEALYLAPADRTLAPDGLRQLAATLFHPLTQADCMLPILRSTDRAAVRTVGRYTKRQITLQKAGGKLPFPGYGMIGLTALTRLTDRTDTKPPSLSCALASTDLYTNRLPEPTRTCQPEALLLSVFPSLRTRIAAILRLPLYLALLGSSPLLCFCGILLSNADLAVELIFAVRIGFRFLTCTLPEALELGKTALGRLLFPVAECFDALPFTDRLSRSKGLIRTLSSAGVGIAAALLYDIPQAIVGPIWALAPLLIPPSPKSPPKALPAAQRRYLHTLCKKCWRYFEESVSEAHPLPSLASDSGSAHADDTTPDAFAFYLVACLSACELGLIDRHTLERRVRNALDAWERFPLYHGLPYDRYSLKTGDCVSGSRIDSAACGRYALSLALLSASLAEYAADHPSIARLAERSALLWQKADYAQLYDNEHSAFYEAVAPSGASYGRLDRLASPAACICIAAIALGQLDPIALKRLRRPFRSARSVGGSAVAMLEDCLVPALFLESKQDSLLGSVQRSVCLAALKETTPLSPQNAALMLPFFPMRALDRLHRSEQTIRLPEDPPSAVCAGQMMAAAVNTLFDRRLSRRLARLPALASLIPLLNEPCDRFEPARRFDAPQADLSSEACEPTDLLPSIFLLGESRWGVLWAEGKRMRIFFDGKPMNFPASLHHLFDDGRFTGLLLFYDGQPIDLPLPVRENSGSAVTLSSQSERYALRASLTLPEEGLLELNLSAEKGGSHLSALFCFCPLCSEGAPFWLETVEDNCLLIRTDGYYAALSAEGLDKRFIRAEDAPFPLGEQSLPSLLERTGSFTEGGLLSPACRIGGKPIGSANCRFRLAFGSSRASVLEKLKRSVPSAPSQSGLLPPLVHEEESALTHALTLELKWLLEEGTLKKVLPTDETDVFSPHLRESLDRALELLQKRGFETAPQPYLLTHIRDLPADELLKGCLSKENAPSLTSPPLPDRTRIRLTDTLLTVKKGKDLPPVGRLYKNEFCTFRADSFQPSFRFWMGREALPLCLTVPAPASREQTSEVALFYAAAEVCYQRSEVRYIGEGYSVRAHLSETYPLLVLEVSAPAAADLRLSLGEASAATEDSRFWHREEGMVDFCTRILRTGQTLFLLGSFKRDRDRLYYQMREEVSAQIASGLPLSAHTPYSATLTWQSKPPYPAPLLVHPALAAGSPEAFPLLLFFDAPSAQRSLVKVFESGDPRSKVSACLLWASATDNTELLREKITYPSPSGEVRESIYLASARALDQLIESSPRCPLLGRILTAFAALAHRMGDRSGETLYREQLASISAARAFHRASDSIEALAERLLSGDPQGVFEWKRRLDALALFPSPEEGSALWSLFWYCILGYRETPDAFTLRPIGSALLDDSAFTLSKKDTLYRIRITLSQTAGCLLDGKESEAHFLFDKKAHFLEIMVEKSARMV